VIPGVDLEDEGRLKRLAGVNRVLGQDGFGFDDVFLLLGAGEGTVRR